MSTCSLFLRAVVLVSTVMVLLVTHYLYAAPPRLDLPVVLPGGSVDLRLTGDSGTNYTVEASADLINWFSLSNGVAVNGLLTVRHEAGPNRPTFFYRASEAASTLPPLTVGPQLDTNFIVSTLLTSAGGSTVLYGFDGTRFTFTLATNSVPEPRILKLTLVTNIIGLPFASGMRGAVRIEPDDLALWGPATLEITFPPGIDRRYLASFFCNADGSGFQVTPDRVRTNTITITVKQPGIFGSSVITAQELADEARREIADPPVPAFAATHLHAASIECPVGSEALAADMRRRLKAAQAASSKATATAMGAARQGQLAGATDDSSSAVMDAADAVCKFYDAHIAPNWITAVQNCAAGRVVLEFALNANRQREILGADGCVGIADTPICLVFQNCLREISNCCQRVTKEAKMVRAVLTMDRQQQMLNLNCFTNEEVKEVIELCSTNAWTGTFSMEGSGSTNKTVTSAGVTTTTIGEYKARFDGTIEESKENGSLSTGLIIQLKILGQLSYNTLHSTETTRSCRSSLNSSEILATGPTEYTILIFTAPDGSYTISTIHTGVVTSPVHGYITTVNFSSDACDPPGPSQNSIRVQPTAGGVPAQATPPYVPGTMTTTNSIAGRLSLDDPTSTPPTKFKFEWSFKRHKLQQ